MNRKCIFPIIVILLFASCSWAQDNDGLFSRLSAISNQGITFYNVDGIDITSETINTAFSKENILKKFKKYPISKKDLYKADSALHYLNYYLLRSETISPDIVQYTSYYFIESKNRYVTAVSFSGINKNDKEFEKEFIELLVNDKIPSSVYEPLVIDSINFAGRKIGLGTSCQWRGINNVQCPYDGQMNWSVHKTSVGAAQSITNQYNIIKSKKGGKVISEEMVDVMFENKEVKAKKVTYDLKGVASVLAGMSGGKTLTIYYVSAPSRSNFVSCVMSFWDNDNIGPAGLPPLLTKVMTLKK